MILIFVNNTRPGLRMICPMCGDVRVASISQLVAHIRLTHSDDPGFCIQCNLQGCKRTFKKFTVYRNHVYSYHDISSSDTALSVNPTADIMPLSHSDIPQPGI